MISRRAAALRRLTEMDTQLQTTVPLPLSMCPARTRATSLHAIGEALLTEDLDPSLMQAFADGLCLMVVTKLDQFPENIFWDVDYLAAGLLRLGDAHAIRDVTAHIVTLHEGFGRVRDHRVATRSRRRSWRLASLAPFAFSSGSGLISPL